MKILSLLRALALPCLVFVTPAAAQSTAEPVTPGYLATDTPTCGTRPIPCFVPYGASGGGGSGGTVYGPDATGNTPTKAPVAVSGINKSGNVQPIGDDARGALIAPNAGASDTTITKCSIPATSATATCNTYVGTGTATAGSNICPAASNLQAQQMRFSAPSQAATAVASLGLSLVGNTLTSGTDGTGTGTPDLILPAQFTLYTLPLPQTNAVNGFNPNAFAVVTTCIQTARQ